MSWRYKLVPYFLLLLPCVIIQLKYNIDFVPLHHVAEWARLGELDKIYADHTETGLGRFFYGPIAVLMLHPLGYFSYSVAKVIWLLLQILSFFLFWICLHKLYPFLKTDRARWAWIFIFIVSINPIHNNFQSNNIQLMLASILMVSEILSHSENKWKAIGAGLICALASSIKVFPLYLALFYFLNRKTYVRVGLLLGGVFSFVLPFLVYDEAGTLFRGFFENLTAYSRDNSLTRIPDILCLPSLIARLFEPFVGAEILSILVKGITGVVGVSFILFAYRIGRKIHGVTQTDLFALIFALSVFLNPSTRPHYFIFLVPAFASCLRHLSEYRSKFLSLWLGLSIVFVAFTAEWVLGGKRFGVDLNNQLERLSVPTYGMTFLVILLLFILSPSRVRSD